MGPCPQLALTWGGVLVGLARGWKSLLRLPLPEVVGGAGSGLCTRIDLLLYPLLFLGLPAGARFLLFTSGDWSSPSKLCPLICIHVTSRMWGLLLLEQVP